MAALCYMVRHWQFRQITSFLVRTGLMQKYSRILSKSTQLITLLPTSWQTYYTLFSIIESVNAFKIHIVALYRLGRAKSCVKLHICTLTFSTSKYERNISSNLHNFNNLQNETILLRLSMSPFSSVKHLKFLLNNKRQ